MQSIVLQMLRVWFPVSILLIVLSITSQFRKPQWTTSSRNLARHFLSHHVSAPNISTISVRENTRIPVCHRKDVIHSASKVIRKVFAQVNKEDLINLPMDRAEMNRMAKMGNVSVSQIDRRSCATGHNDFTGVENDSTSEPKPLDRNAPTPYVTQNGCKYRLLLIVIFNLDKFFENAEFIRQLYKDAFSKIVFYSTSGGKAGNIGKSPHLFMGYKQHITIAQAMGEHPGYDGYWWIGDDVLLNFPYLFATMNFTKVWTTSRERNRGRVWPSPGEAFADNIWVHWNAVYGMPAVQQLYMCLRPVYLQRMRDAFKCSHCVVYMGSDVGYIPSRFVKEFLELSFVFRYVLHEIALPTILRLMVPNVKQDVFEDRDKFIYVWSGYIFAQIRDQWEVETTFAHPVKFSKLVPGSRDFAVEKLAESAATYSSTLARH